MMYACKKGQHIERLHQIKSILSKRILFLICYACLVNDLHVYVLDYLQSVKTLQITANIKIRSEKLFLCLC
jgi:hypothetical protein